MNDDVLFLRLFLSYVVWIFDIIQFVFFQNWLCEIFKVPVLQFRCERIIIELRYNVKMRPHQKIFLIVRRNIAFVKPVMTQIRRRSVKIFPLGFPELICHYWCQKHLIKLEWSMNPFPIRNQSYSARLSIPWFLASRSTCSARSLCPIMIVETGRSSSENDEFSALQKKIRLTWLDSFLHFFAELIFEDLLVKDHFNSHEVVNSNTVFFKRIIHRVDQRFAKFHHGIVRRPIVLVHEDYFMPASGLDITLTCQK